jgi:UDP-N-acetylglucosamine 2-epimerase (non-hydrolysing)
MTAFELVVQEVAPDWVLWLDPLGYLEFLSLMDSAGGVLTDSGGTQEETTFLGVPCLTLRPSTERPVTVEKGTNTLVWDASPSEIADTVRNRIDMSRTSSAPPKWDGNAADRIADDLLQETE